MISRRMLTLAPLQALQAAVGLGAIAAFTRLMSAEEFGRYALALSVSMAAHTLLFTWAEAAAFRFLPQARERGQMREHFATLAAIAACLGAGVLAAVGAALMLLGLPESAAALCIFAACAAVLRFLVRIARESDRAELAFARFAALESLYIGIGFAAGVACLLVFDFGAAAPFAGLALAGLVVAALDAPRLVARWRGGAPSSERARSYVGYGAPLAMALALDVGVQALTRAILALGAGAASVGAYAAAFGLARPLDLIFMGLSAAFAPLLLARFDAGDGAGVRAIASKAFSVFAALAIPAAAGLCALASPLASLLVGDALAPQAAATLPWLALAGLCSGFALYYWSEAFQLSRRTGLRAMLMVGPAMLQLALTAWLAPRHGAAGAAMAAALAAALSLTPLAGVGRRLAPLPAPPTELGRVLLATAAMLAALWLAPYGLNLFAKIAAAVLVYAAAVTALDLFGLRAHAAAFAARLLGKTNPPPPAIATEQRAPSQPLDDERVVALGRQLDTTKLSVLTPFHRHDPSDLLARFAGAPAGVEFVLLDDGSGSASLLADVIRAAEALGAPARIVVWGRNRGRSAARNRLIEEARGEHVLFLDADMLPDSDRFLSIWLGVVHTQQPAVAFGGLSLHRAASTPETALHYSLFSASDCRAARLRRRSPAQFTASANLLVRRDVLVQFPFDDAFTGWGFEDTEWALRVSETLPILHIDNPATHAGLDTVDALMRKSVEAGPNFARLARKHPRRVSRFAAHRAARMLRAAPGRQRIRDALAWVARDPTGSAPMAVRRTALRLYRIAHYAEHLS